MNGNTNYAQINKGETLNAWSVAMNLVPWLEDQDELQREQSYRGKNSHSNGLPLPSTSSHSDSEQFV